MDYRDEKVIIVESGHGGAGSVAFHREKYVDRGGPDGGDGGDGGDIIFCLNPKLRNLHHIHHNRIYKADTGQAGSRNKCSGARGKSLEIQVPPGTQIRDAQTQKLLVDFASQKEDKVVFLGGGKGGLGNMNFATSRNQAPEYAQSGLPGKRLEVALDLKLIADAGLVGLPNAGKSTLLSKITNAHPKIAAYPFTTLRPNVGIIQTLDYKSYTIADIPGIIAGASRGLGLGLSFLRHIERVRILVIILDASSVDIVGEYQTLLTELESYNENLIKLPKLLLLNKLDLVGDLYEEIKSDFCEKTNFQGEILAFSALNEEGLNQVKTRIIELLDEHVVIEENGIMLDLKQPNPELEIIAGQPGDARFHF